MLQVLVPKVKNLRYHRKTNEDVATVATQDPVPGGSQQFSHAAISALADDSDAETGGVEGGLVVEAVGCVSVEADGGDDKKPDDPDETNLDKARKIDEQKLKQGILAPGMWNRMNQAKKINRIKGGKKGKKKKEPKEPKKGRKKKEPKEPKKGRKKKEKKNVRAARGDDPPDGGPPDGGGDGGGGGGGGGRGQHGKVPWETYVKRAHSKSWHAKYHECLSLGKNIAASKKSASAAGRARTAQLRADRQAGTVPDCVEV